MAARSQPSVADQRGRRTVSGHRIRQAAEQSVGVDVSDDKAAEGSARPCDPPNQRQRQLAGERIEGRPADHGATGIQCQHGPTDLCEIDRDPGRDGAQRRGKETAVTVHHGECAQYARGAVCDGPKCCRIDRLRPALGPAGELRRRFIERHEIAAQLILDDDRGKPRAFSDRFLGLGAFAHKLHDQRDQGEDDEEKADHSDAEPPAPTCHSSTCPDARPRGCRHPLLPIRCLLSAWTGKACRAHGRAVLSSREKNSWARSA